LKFEEEFGDRVHLLRALKRRQILILSRLQETGRNDKQKKAGPCQSRPNLRRKEKRKSDRISVPRELPDAVHRALAGRQVTASILSRLAIAAEPLAEFTEFDQLGGGEHLTELKFTSEPQFCDLGLGKLKFLQSGGDFVLVEGVGVDCHVESTVGFAEAEARLFHQRAAGLVHPSDLLNLLGCQA
jgi:hypothetical protein